MALNIDGAAGEMSAAIDHLLSLDAVSGDVVGVTGFCMGGGLCYVIGAARPDVVSAIAPYYGVIPWPSVEPAYADMSCAVQGHYAQNDEHALGIARNILETLQAENKFELDVREPEDPAYDPESVRPRM